MMFGNVVSGSGVMMATGILNDIVASLNVSPPALSAAAWRLSLSFRTLWIEHAEV